MTAATPLRTLAPPREGRRHFIPALPTLWPSMLLPFPRRGRAPFPLFGARAYRWYMARSAVYHGARMLGLAGREVLVPAYHHGSEIGALIHAGCIPRYVRVDRRMRLDLDDLWDKLGPRTGAVYVIHYAGFPQPVDEIAALAARAGVPLIEDCALSLLSADGARPLGSTGDLAVFCLYKTVPVPNGGLLVVNGKLPFEPPRRTAPPLPSTLSHLGTSLLANLALRFGEAGEALRDALRRAGRAARSASGAHHVPTGSRVFNPALVDYGMSALSDVILRRVDWPRIVERRRRNYYLVLARLRDRLPPVYNDLAPGVCPLFYPLLCPDKETLKHRLAARGIETVDFWREGHASCPAREFPEAEALRRRVLELPIHQDLDPEDAIHVADAVRECLP